MSLPLTIPTNSFPIVTATAFNALFNNPTLNRYDWGKAANTNVTILALERWSVYVIERVNFSCNIPEADFQDNLVDSNLPSISLKLKSLGQQIFLTVQPFINFVDNLELLKFFHTTQDGDELQATFTGELTQSGAIAGKADIDALVQFNIYRIDSTDWVKKYFDEKLDLGAGLRFRG